MPNPFENIALELMLKENVIPLCVYRSLNSTSFLNSLLQNLLLAANRLNRQVRFNNLDIIDKVNLGAQLGRNDHSVVEIIMQNVLFTKKKFFRITITGIMNK